MFAQHATMKTATFRFYDELNDFLPPERKSAAFEHPFEFSSSLKDMIESFGVPHTEIGLVLLNGKPSRMDASVSDEDRIDVHPHYTHLNRYEAGTMPSGIPLAIRFVADVHLGRLAAYLRMLGFDTLYRNDFGDDELAKISSAEDRILLTMDRGLLKRSIVEFGYFVRAHEPRKQLVEVLRRYTLFDQIREFSRCLECNASIQKVAKEQVSATLPPRTREFFNDFLQCPACLRVYWRGSHYEHMARFIEAIRSAR